MMLFAVVRFSGDAETLHFEIEDYYKKAARTQ
jgi:hypothetical protein